MTSMGVSQKPVRNGYSFDAWKSKAKENIKLSDENIFYSI